MQSRIFSYNFLPSTSELYTAPKFSHVDLIFHSQDIFTAIAQPDQNWGRGQICFESKRATVLGLGHRVSKHKTLRYTKIFWGNGPFGPPLGTTMFHKALDIEQKSKFGQKKLTLNETNVSLSWVNIFCSSGMVTIVTANFSRTN